MRGRGRGEGGGGLSVDFKRGEWKGWNIAWKHRHVL